MTKFLVRFRRTGALLGSVVALLIAAGPFAPAAAGGAMPQDGQLEVGDRAPMFPAALPSTAGERPGARTISLDEVLGRKNIVLAFYVADWTGG